jgi:protein-S-isoprenylcysteine O-methyltransferase Ste14
LRGWAAACAGNHTRSATIAAPRLVTGGPYSRVRNPIYLGTVILGMGMTGLIGDLRLAPLLVAACALLYLTIIPAEEQFLARKFGAAYASYRNAVPRLIPRFRKWREATPVQPVWRNARGEAGIAATLAAIYGALRWAGEF